MASSPHYQPLHLVCFIMLTFIVPYNLCSNVMIFVCSQHTFSFYFHGFRGLPSSVHSSFPTRCSVPMPHSGFGYWPPCVCFKFSLFQEVMTCFMRTVLCYHVSSPLYESLRVPPCFGIEPRSLKLFFASITMSREGSCLYIVYFIYWQWHLNFRSIDSEDDFILSRLLIPVEALSTWHTVTFMRMATLHSYYWLTLWLLSA